jgi:hypothetical protein
MMSLSFFPLNRLVQTAGQDGINKLVTSFLVNHPGVSKRQAEIKINEVAIKEKRPEDKYIIWHIRPDYEKFLNMTEEEAVVAAAGMTPTEPAASAKKRKKEEVEEANGGALAENAPAAESSGAVPPGFEGKEPKRYKRAFGFFVKAKRADAEAQLGTSASVRNPPHQQNPSLGRRILYVFCPCVTQSLTCQRILANCAYRAHTQMTDALKNLLTAMWDQASAEDREPYEKKEQEDQARCVSLLSFPLFSISPRCSAIIAT